jgi:CHAT domain-containing protein/tetratricopeptide (TPR) repeat protein
MLAQTERVSAIRRDNFFLRLLLLSCLLACSLETVGQASAPLPSLAKINFSATNIQQDETRAAARKLIADAEQLYAKGTAEARRMALEKYQEAAALFHTLGDKTAEAAALSDVGAVYDSLGDKQKALEFFSQALPLRRAAGDRQGEATTLNNFGVIYRSLGEMQKALDYYDQSLAISRALQDSESEAATLNNLGAIYRALGELQLSLDAYAQALPLLRSHKNSRGEAITLSNLGGVYRSLGQPEKALEFYEQSLVRAREARDTRVEGETLNNIGAVQRSLDNQSKALEFFNQALALRRAVGDRRGEAGTLNNLGSVSVSLGEGPKALEFYEQSLKLWRAVGDRSGEAGTLHNIAEVYYIAGDKEKAGKHFNEALLLRRAVEDYQGEANTLHGIARIARDEGRLTDARRDIEAALVIVENLRAKLASPDLRASYFANVQKYYEFYVSVLMSLHRQLPANGNDVAALQASERARARGLLDLLQEARADLKPNADVKLLARERELVGLINAKAAQQAQAYGNTQRAALAKSLGEEIAKLSSEYEILQAQIKQSNPRYAELTKTTSPALADMQKLLDEQTLLLEYKLGEDRSYLWLVASNSFAGYELPTRAEIETLARQVYELLVERNRSVGEETTAQNRARIENADKQLKLKGSLLGQMLLGPVASQLGNKRLVIVADGALQFIPFAALFAPNASKKEAGLALMATHQVVNLPSIAVLAQLRRDTGKHPDVKKTLAVFADPVFEPDDPRLPRALNSGSNSLAQQSPGRAHRGVDQDQGTTGLMRLPASREVISGLAPRNTVLRALDFEANRDRAMSAEIGQYRILHFATHGLLNTSRPELSGIALSLYDVKGNPRDGFLRLNQIYNLKLSSDLVVLSACRSALGKEVRGEGLIGLTRGFMYAGAPRVVASLWKVHDEATGELMKIFYRNLFQKKMTASQSLRAAQVEMQKQIRWRSPYYWAAFTLQGDWK